MNADIEKGMALANENMNEALLVLIDAVAYYQALFEVKKDIYKQSIVDELKKGEVAMINTYEIGYVIGQVMFWCGIVTLYLFPSIFAGIFGLKKRKIIFGLNVAFGWTIIGWVILNIVVLVKAFKAYQNDLTERKN